MSAVSELAEIGLPIQVLFYPPTPGSTTPLLPESLIDLILAERCVEPHRNTLSCSRCGHVYGTSIMEGMGCTWRDSNGWTRCGGTVTARWTRESARQDFLARMRHDGVVIAWQWSDSKLPVGFAVCEPHEPDTLCEALDMPVDLGEIYEVLGRDVPYLVVTHLWMPDVPVWEATVLIWSLIHKALEPQMRRLGLSEAPVIVPVDADTSELRHSFLRAMLAKSRLYRPFARDVREGRRRMLLGFRVRVR